MLAHARLRGLPLDTYLHPDHPVQHDIISCFAEMCDVPRAQVAIGLDGCSAPTFAVPLNAGALAFARLCDPADLTQARRAACRKITDAMTSHPEMISGRAEFDCRLMQVGRGRILCKRGAEGYQAVGLLPGASKPDSRGIGIAFKVSDGDLLFRTINIDPLNRVRPAVTLAILRALGALDEAQLAELSGFGPTLPLENHRGLVTGESRPVFDLRLH
jgi:L-asparaginase II